MRLLQQPIAAQYGIGVFRRRFIDLSLQLLASVGRGEDAICDRLETEEAGLDLNLMLAMAKLVRKLR